MMFLLKPFIRLLSMLPLRVLYALSSLLYPFVFHVLAYRRVTVRRNLSMSFPDKPSAELRKIEKAFYRHFCDLIAESIKAFSISGTMLDERVTVTNLEQIRDFIASGKSVVAVLGHIGNWEWLVLKVAKDSDFPFTALYRPAGNRGFTDFLKAGRQRYGARLLPTSSIRELVRSIEEEPLVLGTLGDQTPVEVDRCHWMQFLRQPTPVYAGPEKLARKRDMAVFFVSMYKTGRGYYHAHIELITDRPAALAENEITESHTRMLEAAIVKQPETWLWTHRRWKRSHLKPEGF
jgi:KDO2-lipid IV(A) lauroyltransferase